MCVSRCDNKTTSVAMRESARAREREGGRKGGVGMEGEEGAREGDIRSGGERHKER